MEEQRALTRSIDQAWTDCDLHHNPRYVWVEDGCTAGCNDNRLCGEVGCIEGDISLLCTFCRAQQEDLLRMSVQELAAKIT